MPIYKAPIEDFKFIVHEVFDVTNVLNKLDSSSDLSQDLIDEIIIEPIGGAHRDIDLTIENVEQSILKNLDGLTKSENSNLLSLRREKYLKYGSTLRI